MEKFHQRFCYRQRNPSNFSSSAVGTLPAGIDTRLRPPRPPRPDLHAPRDVGDAHARARRPGRAGAPRRARLSLRAARASRARASSVRAAQSPAVPRRAALALSGAASLATGAAALGASAGASPTPSPASSTAFARSGAARNRVVFDDARVAIPGSGQSVPVATWFPDASGAGAAAPSAISDRRDPTSSPLYYPHAISVAKIARVLLNTPESTPRWLDRQTPLLAAPGVRFAARGETSSATAAAAFGKVAVLCHGSRGQPLRPGWTWRRRSRVRASSCSRPSSRSRSPRRRPRPRTPGRARRRRRTRRRPRDEVVDAALRAFAPKASRRRRRVPTNAGRPAW